MIKRMLQDAAEVVMYAEYGLEAHRRNRDALIIRAHAEGLSLRQIGELAGVSHQTVANIVAARAATTTSQHAPLS